MWTDGCYNSLTKCCIVISTSSLNSKSFPSFFCWNKKIYKFQRITKSVISVLVVKCRAKKKSGNIILLEDGCDH